MKWNRWIYTRFKLTLQQWRTKGGQDGCPLMGWEESACTATGSRFSPAAKSLPPLDLEGFPEVPQPQTPTMLLAVSSRRADHVSLQQILRDTSWELCQARKYWDALKFLCNDRMAVVISACLLPDGNWKDILGQIAVLPDAPRLIVTSSEPDDRLWAEVLNLGGHDVLTTPFDKHEVIRSVSHAWQSWEDEWHSVNRRRLGKTRVLAQSA